MSPREAAAVAMVLAGATRRAACDKHNVYPANLRRALKEVQQTQALQCERALTSDDFQGVSA